MLVVVLALAAAGLVGGGIWYQRKESAALAKTLETKEEDLNQTVLLQQKIEKDGKTYYLRNNLTSYLILGTDLSDEAPVNTKGREEGYICKMADMLLVLVVDDTNRTYTILQIDRNTITDVQQLYATGEIAAVMPLQINTAYFYGHDDKSGCENELQAVSKLLKNTPIDHYISLNMTSIGEINHIAGGVTVTLEDDFTKLDPSMKEGTTLKLTDEQASYFTARRMDIGDGTNTGRLRRQRTYLNGLIAALRDDVKKDSGYIDTAYDQIQSLMTTDMTAGNFGSMGSVLLTYQDKGIVTIDGKTTVGVNAGDTKEHGMFTPDEDSLRDTRKNNGRIPAAAVAARGEITVGQPSRGCGISHKSIFGKLTYGKPDWPSVFFLLQVYDWRRTAWDTSDCPGFMRR